MKFILNQCSFYFSRPHRKEILTINFKFSKWKWRSNLGKDWESKFNQTASLAYKAVNVASATGNYSILSPISNIALIDTIKSQRAKLSGLKISWKLHQEVSQDIICARQQEVMVQDEFVGQMAVRFVTDQVGPTLLSLSEWYELQADHTVLFFRVWKLEMEMVNL